MIFRNNKIARLALVLWVLGGWLWGCTALPEPSPDLPTVEPNAPLALVAEWADRGVAMPEGVVFGGVVVANDWGGNFYRSIVVEDESGAVEVNIALYALHNLYPIGARVAIRAEGLSAMTYEGVVQVGRAPSPWNDYRVEPIGVPAEIDRRVVVVGNPTEEEPVEPMVCRVGELTEQMCGRVVRVEGLRYVGTDTDWGSNAYASTSYRLFSTPEGDSLAVATSRYADFATCPLPADDVSVSVSGVLYRGRHFGADMYVLKPRTYEDICEQQR